MLEKLNPGDTILVTIKEGTYRLKFMSTIPVPQTGQTFIEVRDRRGMNFLDMEKVIKIEKEDKLNGKAN